MKRNYHTHHHLCGHATGSAEDYVKEAIKQRFDILGFSDHAPNYRVNDFGVRMKEAELAEYLKDIEKTKAKYSNKIKIYTGLEVEYFDDHEEYYQNYHEILDYMIHGQHYISMTDSMNDLISGFALTKPEQILKYAEYLEKAMTSGHFAMLAHPDLYMCGYKNFDETAKIVAHRICKMASELNVILEFNANGYRRGISKTPQGETQPYPRMEFWEIAKSYNCLTLLNSDCHSPEILYDRVVKKAEDVYLSLSLNDAGKLPIK
ncbi:MAG: histidinol-phosphatase [Firmicutes bacterium]|nr:histidinol-phosphatase [Bacillota bacterium]